MKMRRVIVEIELETEATVKEIKRAYLNTVYFDTAYEAYPLQVTVNVIRVPEPKRKARKK